MQSPHKLYCTAIKQHISRKTPPISNHTPTLPIHPFIYGVNSPISWGKTPLFPLQSFLLRTKRASTDKNCFVYGQNLFYCMKTELFMNNSTIMRWKLDCPPTMIQLWHKNCFVHKQKKSYDIKLILFADDATFMASFSFRRQTILQTTHKTHFVRKQRHFHEITFPLSTDKSVFICLIIYSP